MVPESKNIGRKLDINTQQQGGLYPSRAVAAGRYLRLGQELTKPWSAPDQLPIELPGVDQRLVKYWSTHG